MTDIAKEIMEYVKLKERPSLMEVVLYSGCVKPILTVTLPIKDGKHVYEVSSRAKGIMRYSLDHDASLIDLMTVTQTIGVNTMLLNHVDESGGSNATIAKWKFSSSESESRKLFEKVLAILRNCN